MKLWPQYDILSLVARCMNVLYSDTPCQSRIKGRVNAMLCNAIVQPNARGNFYVMLRFLHTIFSGARHVIQLHLLSIQFLFLRSFVYKTAAKLNPKKKRSVIYPSLHGVLERYNTMQCNAMQCNAMQCNGTAQR